MRLTALLTAFTFLSFTLCPPAVSAYFASAPRPAPASALT